MKRFSPSRSFMLSLGVLALLAGGSGTARADDHDRDHDRDRQEHRDDHDRGHDERGAGPNHDLRRGAHLPASYRSHQYVVDDWRGHHLRQPPRGYHWVQVGGDYVLAAIATGVIADMLLNG